MAHMKNRDSNRKRREDRQIQAKVRQEAYDLLSNEEKLAKLGNLTAAKQRVKLSTRRSAVIAVVSDLTEKEAHAAVAEVKKGAKARRQERKDKKARTA